MYEHVMHAVRAVDWHGGEYGKSRTACGRHKFMQGVLWLSSEGPERITCRGCLAKIAPPTAARRA